MKRFLWSVMIGIVATGLFVLSGRVLFKPESKGIKDLFKPSAEDNPTVYSIEMKISVGSPDEDEITKEEALLTIRNRLLKKGLSIEIKNEHANIFRIRIENTGDTSEIKQTITQTGKIGFSEVYTMDMLSGIFIQMKFDQKTKIPEAAGSLASELISNEEKAANNQLTFFDLVQFSHPYTTADTAGAYSASIGQIKVSDTTLMNTLLNDKLISNYFPGDAKFYYGTLTDKVSAGNQKAGNEDLIDIYILKRKVSDPDATLSEKDIKDAYTNFDFDRRPVVTMIFNNYGAKLWEQMTRRNTNRPIAIVIDNSIISAPLVNEVIENGNCTLSGQFTLGDCETIASLLSGGELKLPVKILDFSVQAKNAGIPLMKVTRPVIIFIILSAVCYLILTAVKPRQKP